MASAAKRLRSKSSSSQPFEAAYPDLGHEAEQEFGWRNTRLSDWRLRCGAEEFQVHTAIVCRGPRALGVLAAACRGDYAAKGGTDLSSMLPEPCWEVVPLVLDYVYDGKFPDDQRHAFLRLFVAADVLQVKPLFMLALEHLNSSFDYKT